MNNENKECLLLDYLISSPDTFALCQSIIEADYFAPELRQAVDFIREYYDEYHTTPSPKQIEAESGVELEKSEITPDQVRYCAVEVETFCKRRAVELAYANGIKHVQDDDYGAALKMMQDAMEVSLHRNLGVRYFETVEERLERMLEHGDLIPTGWDTCDELLFGGWGRGELLMCAANSGGGKSIALGNLAVHGVELGEEVLYVTFELSEDLVGQRFDTMFTGIGRKVWKDNISGIVQGVKTQSEKSGSLTIKYMSRGTKASEIRSYLKEYYLKYKKYPDRILVDYLDEMEPNEKISADNIFQRDKACAGELRQLGVDFDMAVATASQLNRDAVKTDDHNHSHIAGGISKINICDVYFTIIMTDIMKAKGICMFKFQKTRNSDGVGSTVHLAWDSKYLRMRDDDGRITLPSEETPQLESAVNTPTASGDKLKNFMLEL